MRALQAWRRESEPQLDRLVSSDAIAKGVAAELERHGQAASHASARRFNRWELAIGWAGILLWLLTILQGAGVIGHR